MSVLVARTGRQQQRYQDGYRLLAGYFLKPFFSLIYYSCLFISILLR